MLKNTQYGSIKWVADQLPESANGKRLFESYKESRSESNALVAAEIISGFGKRIGSKTFVICKRQQYFKQIDWKKM